jgi:GxxExxY protein
MKTPSKISNRREPSAELDQLAHAVIGAAIQVHRALGPGYIESVYEEAMCVEMDFQTVPYQRQY